MLYGMVPHDAAVAEADHASGVLGDVVLVRDEQDRQVSLDVEALEDAHDFDARPRVEIARRLVGQQHTGSFTSARAMATRCCCPPESWLRS